MNNTYSWRENVEVEAVFVHVADAFGCTDVLDRLRTRRSEIYGIPDAPRSFSSWRLTKQQQ